MRTADPISLREDRPSDATRAFVLRIAPSYKDRVQLALEEDVAIIGWPAPELLNPTLDRDAFRAIVQTHFYPNDDTRHRAGRAAGHLWRFIREMQVGDFVLTPHPSGFYVGRITGPAVHLPEKVAEDTAFRRSVAWLNGKTPIRRDRARAALQSRLKIQGTSADATDLLPDILECLGHAGAHEPRTFYDDLQARLVTEALTELRTGCVDSYTFERLVQTVLLGLGAQDARIIGRQLDKGADILAHFRVAGAFRLVVAVQVKHFRAEPPVGATVVEQLIHGIEAEGASLGMVVTSGTISAAASAAAERYFDEKGVRIELIDGPELAALIVEHGLRAR